MRDGKQKKKKKKKGGTKQGFDATGEMKWRLWRFRIALREWESL